MVNIILRITGLELPVTHKDGLFTTINITIYQVDQSLFKFH
jgi:hypothetical protein